MSDRSNRGNFATRPKEEVRAIASKGGKSSGKNTNRDNMSDDMDVADDRNDNSRGGAQRRSQGRRDNRGGQNGSRGPAGSYAEAMSRNDIPYDDDVGDSGDRDDDAVQDEGIETGETTR